MGIRKKDVPDDFDSGFIKSILLLPCNQRQIQSQFDSPLYHTHDQSNDVGLPSLAGVSYPLHWCPSHVIKSNLTVSECCQRTVSVLIKITEERPQ